MIVIPWVTGQAWFRQDIALSGSVFRLEAQYNNNGEFWTMDIATRDGEILLQGIKLKVGLIWGGQAWNNPKLPQGVIAVVSDDIKANSVPNFDDMGTVTNLVYIDALV